MEIPALDKPLMDWDESDVHQWLSSLGASQYESQIREQSIRGDVVYMLDSNGLKSLGINTIGQRLAVLRGIYQLKLANGIPIAPDDYVPPSEAAEMVSIPSVHELYTTVLDQNQRLRALEAGNRKLVELMHHFVEDVSKYRSSQATTDDDSSSRLLKQINLLRNDMGASGRSPSPVAVLQDGAEREPTTSIPDPSISAYLTPQSTTHSHDTVEQNNRVSLDDPTSKVLPAALKKHRIKPQDWPNYAMLITYGPPSNRIKRRLEPDEKPLYLFKKLKDAKKNPAFVLKNMKELRTPAIDERQEPGPSSDTSWLSMSRTTGI
ncbi:hypothetical protein BJ165DRAFT_1438701 [Panaeolus papilionaceus]|nr:hypothetical protein BJ165DRAFT_1438701 [Panaeolus papilionaceus]